MHIFLLRSSFPLAALLIAVSAAGCSQRATQDGLDKQAGGTSQTPEPATTLREQLIVAMSGYEHVVSKAELESLGSPDALVGALTGIYNDKAVHLATRVQALTSLRFFPQPASKAALETAIAGPETPDVVRRSALRAYGVGFRDDAINMIGSFLDHRDLHTRNAAARSLSDLHTQRALAVLRLRLPEEKDAMVKSTIQAGLDRPR